jgi:hypothetical protein
MTFPTAGSGFGNYSGSTAATTHAVTYGVTVSANCLAIMAGRVAAVGAVSLPAGWTLVSQDSSDASDDVTFWGYKSTRTAGTEGGTTVTVTHGSAKMCAFIFVLAGAADPATRPPEASAYSIGTTTSGDPPIVTPTGGAKDYLWIALCGYDGEPTSTASPPGSYVYSNNESNSGTGGAVATNSNLAYAMRQLNAASEDPGAFSIAVGTPATGWTAFTLAVHPAPPAVPSLIAAGNRAQQIRQQTRWY